MNWKCFGFAVLSCLHVGTATADNSDLELVCSGKEFHQFYQNGKNANGVHIVVVDDKLVVTGIEAVRGSYQILRVDASGFLFGEINKVDGSLNRYTGELTITTFLPSTGKLNYLYEGKCAKRDPLF